jgi:xylulokinase
MRDHLLGVDVGTSAVKAVLVSAEGGLMASSGQSYALDHPAPGRTEQRAEDWWRALVASVREVTKGVDAGRIAALGLSTQGGTLVPVDALGHALCPAASWIDTRAASQQAEFEARVGGERMHGITGWEMCGGLNALQILWLKQNRPEVFRAAAKFLSVPGYLTLRLTGRAAVDASSAGIEQLLDIYSGRWSEQVLEILGIGEGRLAELVFACEAVGTLTAEAAEALGLSTSVVVTAGGHDQYCAALGAGAAAQSDRLLATGTAWAAVAILDAPPEGEACLASVSRHVVQGLWGALLSLEGGGGSLMWLRRVLSATSFEQLDQLAADCPAGAGGLRFYPYFSGAEYPAGLLKAEAGFVGLSLSHGAGHMARAVMEGVACQAVWMLEAFGRDAGGALILTGGASKSPLWTRMIADIAGRALTLPSIPDAGCLGAAALAGVAAGLFASPVEGARALSGARRQAEPGPDAARYRDIFSAYKAGARRMASAREG